MQFGGALGLKSAKDSAVRCNFGRRLEHVGAQPRMPSRRQRRIGARWGAARPDPFCTRTTCLLRAMLLRSAPSPEDIRHAKAAAAGQAPRHPHDGQVAPARLSARGVRTAKAVCLERKTRKHPVAIVFHPRPRQKPPSSAKSCAHTGSRAPCAALGVCCQAKFPQQCHINPEIS